MANCLQYLTVSSIKLSEAELKKFFDNEYDPNETYWCTKLQEANWYFETDLENSEAEETLVSIGQIYL